MLQFSEIQDAAARLQGVAHRTPVVTSRTLDDMLGLRVLMKAENLQRMGAFKFRGGYNAVNVAWWPSRRATMRRPWRWPRGCTAARPPS
jgi:threonine dehydratase